MRKLSRDGDNNPKTKRLISHSFDIRLKGNPKLWMQNLSDAGFRSIIIENNRLILHHSNLEDSDSSMIKIVLKKDGLDLSYHQDKSDARIRKRLEAAHLCLLTLSASQASDPPAKLSAFIAESFDLALDYVSEDLDLLIAQNNLLKDKLKDYENRIDSLNKKHDEDSNRLIACTQKISNLNDKIKQLTEISDNQLDDELIEWLISHDGKIDISWFSKEKSIPYSRVEKSLNRLCATNRIERIK
jgi:hypothetical protein